MCRSTITCDQAIFTSIRTPMGEGYRIVAAGKGLSQAEKQTITRNSPSHGGLCHPQDAAEPANDGLSALAFYPLPSGRLCVALSCEAGAEHTGRGGGRIYTHNLIFLADCYDQCGYNPFTLARAFIQQELFVTELKPQAVLPAVEIPVTCQPESAARIRLHPSMQDLVGPAILDRLLTGASLILNLPEQWIETAEALLLGIPGSLRHELSLAAGLRFSLGRGHQFHLVFDDTPKTKNSAKGQTVDFVDAADAAESNTTPSRWAAFVAKYWRDDAMTELSNRTNRSFDDVTPQGCNYIAKLYDDFDAVANGTATQLLTLLREYLGGADDRPERELRTTVMKQVASGLANRLASSPPSAIQSMWGELQACWKLDTQGTMVTLPAIETAIRRLLRAEPVAACSMALDLLANDRPDPQQLRGVIDDSLNALTQHLRHDSTACTQGEFQHVCRTFQLAHPDWPAVVELCQALETSREKQSAPSFGGA